jgi:hypothetical protein
MESSKFIFEAADSDAGGGGGGGVNFEVNVKK